jgi:hypothetical protein
MSNTTDDNKDVELPKSRLSSASRKNEEQKYAIGARIKSPITPRQDISQVNNQKLTDENRSPLNSHDNEEQPSFNNHSRSSFHVNQQSNDGPTDKNLHLYPSQDQQDQINFNGDSVDIITDDEHLNSSQRQTTNRTRHSKYLACSFFLFSYKIFLISRQ